MGLLATENEAASNGGSQIWSCYSVLNVLYSLVQKSRVNEYLVAVKGGKNEEEIAQVFLFGNIIASDRFAVKS